jgi:hypothetical protein
MHANSTQFIFMEGCFRAFVGADEDPPIFLSSGTEDYFNSANYFNAGEFRLPNSGLTYKNDESFTISAYRVHERDPVVFQNGLRLLWRNSDELPSPTLDKAANYTPPSWLCPITFPWYGTTATRASTLASEERTQVRAVEDGPYKRLAAQATFLVWVYEWPSPTPLERN